MLVICWVPNPLLNIKLYISLIVKGIGLNADYLAIGSLDQDLHKITLNEFQMEIRLFLNVVIAETASVLEPLKSKDETLSL